MDWWSQVGFNVLGGFLAAVAFAALGALLKWLRRPWFIPFEAKEWSEKTKKTLAEWGYVEGECGWFHPAHLERRYEQGSRLFRVGYFFREVRCRVRQDQTPEGYFVLMKGRKK